MHQFRKPTLWHLIICYFHSSGTICRRDIQAESSSSNPDVSRFPPDSLRSGNHRKSLEVLVFICTWRLTWKLRIKVLLDTQMHATALEYVALAGSSKTVPQCAPRSGPEAGQRAGWGKSSAAWPSTRGRPGVRTCPPWTWFWSVAMPELKGRPPTTTTLVELKETIGSFAQSMDEEVRQAVQVPADELASVWSVTVPRLRRDSIGPDSVVLCRPITVICVLKLKQ